MAFYDDTGIGTPVNGGYSDISNLSNLQSPQALYYGNQAASLADPFATQRPQYQKALSDLLANPGSITSNPAYQFAYNQGLEAVNRKGNVRSGAKLAALTNYGQGLASQQFMPLANLYSNLAMSGSSPSAAANAFMGGANRSQDYSQLGTAARTVGRQQSAQPQQTPWWAQMPSTQPTSAYSTTPGYVDPYASLNAYNQQTAQNVNDIYSGKYDNSLMQQYGIGQPLSNVDYSGYDPYNDPYGMGNDYSLG